MIFLSIKNVATTSEITQEFAQKIMYHIRNMLIIHVGIKDFEDDLNKNVFDRLKKQIKILDDKISLIFRGAQRDYIES